MPQSRQSLKCLPPSDLSYSIFGEEYGVSGPADAEYQWVIDPIDGTTNFVRGVPVWATLIALVHNGVPVLGVVSAPAMGFRWWATTGGGAFFSNAGRDATRIYVSKTQTIAEAHVSTTPNAGWQAVGGIPKLVQLQTDALRARGFGDFWQHMLVAQGAIDVAVDVIGLAAIRQRSHLPHRARSRWHNHQSFWCSRLASRLIGQQ